MSKGRDRSERFIAMAAEPSVFDRLLAFIVEGGTLAKWCRQHDVRYSDYWQWLHDVDHAERVERYTTALEGRQAYLGDVVVSGLTEIAEADIRKLYDGKGKLLDAHKLPDELARVVSEVSEDEDARTGNIKRKVKLESRKGGHELLGRAIGLYKDKLVHEGKLTLEELVGGSHNGDAGSMAPGLSERDSRPNPRSSSKT